MEIYTSFKANLDRQVNQWPMGLCFAYFYNALAFRNLKSAHEWNTVQKGVTSAVSWCCLSFNPTWHSDNWILRVHHWWITWGTVHGIGIMHSTLFTGDTNMHVRYSLIKDGQGFKQEHLKCYGFEVLKSICYCTELCLCCYLYFWRKCLSI